MVQKNHCHNLPIHHYFGCCKIEFKARFYNNPQSFINHQKANTTEILKAVWK